MHWEWQSDEPFRNLIDWGALVLFGTLLFGSVMCSCTKQEDFTMTTYRGVERILMHEPHRYSFFIEGQTRVLTVNVISRDEVYVKPDVAPGEKCWIEVGAPWVQNECQRIKLVIHLHSFKEINGAGWNHGKFGHGETVVIE